DQAESNSLQVRVELQADCLAGVWANRAQAKWQFIEPGDVESALQTASGRRSAAMPSAGLRSAGLIYPRHFSTTFAVVHDWLEIGRRGELRHVSLSVALIRQPHLRQTWPAPHTKHLRT